MRRVPANIMRLYSVNASFELAYGFMLPALTFLFFSHTSPFYSLLSYMMRSFLYGLCLALVRWGGLLANTVLMFLSDKAGRRFAYQVACAGLLCLGLMPLLGIYGVVPWLFVSGFFVYGLLDTHKPNGIAAVGDVVAPQERMRFMGYLQAALAVGACVGPVVGGFLTHGNLSWPFMAICVVALFAAWLSRRVDNAKPAEKPRMWRGYKMLLAEPGVRKILLILLFGQIGWSAYYEFMPAILKTVFGFSAVHLGWFIGLIALWLIIASTFGIKWLSRYQMRRVFIFSGTVFVLGLLSTLLATLWGMRSLLWFGSIACAMGDVLVYTLLITYLTKLLPPEMRGRGAGLTFILISIVWGGVALAGGFLLALSHTLILVLGLVFSVVMLQFILKTSFEEIK